MLKGKTNLFILIIVILALLFYIIHHREEFRLINQIDYLFLIPLVLFALGMLISNGLLTKLFVRLFGTELSPQEWFGLAAVTAMGNYLAPFRGGVAVRALYLKKKHQFPYTTFLATYSAYYLLMFLVGSLLGLIAITLIYLTYQLVYWGLFSLFLIVGLAVWGAMRLSDYTPQGTGSISQHWRNLSRGWQSIKGDKSLLLKIILVLIINYVITGLQLYCGYRAIAHEIPYLAAWFMAIILSFSIFISLTPGNLGIQEAVIGILSKLFGLGFNEGLLVAGLLRVVTISIAFTLGPIFSYKLTKS